MLILKNLKIFTAILLFIASAKIFAQSSPVHSPTHDPSHAKKHYFVLFGKQELYASHYVFMPPHNYQVELEISLTDNPNTLEIQKQYLAARSANPDQDILILFDSFLVEAIKEKPIITGKLVRQDQNGNDILIKDNIKLESTDYKVLFFNEVEMH